VVIDSKEMRLYLNGNSAHPSRELPVRLLKDSETARRAGVRAIRSVRALHGRWTKYVCGRFAHGGADRENMIKRLTGNEPDW
jgi:hypothetical protein